MTGTDPYLDLPLHGVRLIEASAGTGKTYTLATLVTRLVSERQLRVGQILAVTFTEAATQELRERLRRRLVLAARIAADVPCEGDAQEIALCRDIIARRRGVEDAQVLRTRLLQAAREMDLAAVHTIHGFCARVLSEHALDTGEFFAGTTLLANDRALREDAAADIWRVLAADATFADVLARLWASPEALAADLVDLLRAPRLLPEAVDIDASPQPALKAAAQALRSTWQAHGRDARACIEAALASGVLSKSRVQERTLATLWPAMEGWTWASTLAPPHARVDLLTRETLVACVNKHKSGDGLASPVFDATRAYLDAHAAVTAWQDARELALLHRVREMAHRRLVQLKRQRRVRGFDDLIDGVARALDGAQGDSLARRLRSQFRAALVDEFQDTDARQWSIFRRLFGDAADDASPRMLALVGDPKQAIYGFRGGDVRTYLAASERAEAAPALLRNFRSRPRVLQAIDRLYANAGPLVFGDTRIVFREVEAGGVRIDAACTREGAPMPGLVVRRLAATDDGKPHAAEPSRDLATRACVQAIVELLSDTRGVHIDGRAAAPADIAVLVRTHRDAQRIQHALGAAGVASVVAGQSSLFASESALEWLALIDALIAPADPRRLHAALAGVWLGMDAHAIDGLLTDETRRAQALGDALDWRERLLRHGPLALANHLCAQHAPRLLEFVDGERRLSDLMQLGETLQQAWPRVSGLHGLADWLRMRIATADDRDPEQQLRLESDARRVQVLTVHKAKGLEFPFVFLPFAGIGGASRTPAWCKVDDALHLRPDTAMKQAAVADAAAEEARLLYVALTRAQHALWLCIGPLYAANTAALHALTGGGVTPCEAIEIDDRDLPDVTPTLRLPTPVAPPRARTARRVLSRDWSIYSFSALARQAAGTVETLLPRGGREDETVDDAPRDDDPRFAGARFGDVVHDAFERVDFVAWRDWPGDAPPPAQREHLVEAFRAGGYTQAEIDDGLPLLASLVGRTLNAPLPEGTRLCDVPLPSRRAEMEFHFTLDDVPVDALLATVQAHGLLADRQGFGARRRLDGLMTGKIDLVYAHAGRYHVLDYKTNRLPDYGPAALERAMHEGEYTLQAAIYTLALHRWLRFRMGDAYDFDRCMGGVRYVFCRGVDVHRMGAGVYAQPLPRALIEALDTLFAGAAA